MAKNKTDVTFWGDKLETDVAIYADATNTAKNILEPIAKKFLVLFGTHTALWSPVQGSRRLESTCSSVAQWNIHKDTAKKCLPQSVQDTMDISDEAIAILKAEDPIKGRALQEIRKDARKQPNSVLGRIAGKMKKLEDDPSGASSGNRPPEELIAEHNGKITNWYKTLVEGEDGEVYLGYQEAFNEYLKVFNKKS